MGNIFSLSGLFEAVYPKDSISQFIVFTMIFIALLYGFFLFFYLVIKIKKRVGFSVKVLSSQNSRGVTLKANLKEEFLQSKDNVLRSQWQQFDQCLISDSSKTKIFSTFDSKYFFNTQTIFPWLSNNRFIVSIPSILVAIGVLGTFIGLVIGLKGLNIDTDDTAILKEGINTLIKAASIAFTTSVWGVFLSLIAGLAERTFERIAYTSVEKINKQIAEMLPMASNEQSLLHIEDSSEQSKAALQTLHEKIGSELQKSVSGIGQQVQDALTVTLNSIMKPAIESLVSNTQQQSSQALEGLVKDFMGGMQQAGQAQTQEMNGAAKAMQESMQEISERLHQVFDRLSNQQDQFLTKTSEQQSSQQIQQQQLIQSLADKQFQIQEQGEKAGHQHQELINNLSTQQQALVQKLADQQLSMQEQAHAQTKEVEEYNKGLISRLSIQQQGFIESLAVEQQQMKQQAKEVQEQHLALISSLSSQQQKLVQDLSSQHIDIQKQSDSRDQARQEQVNATIQGLGKEQAGLLAELTEFSRNAARQNDLLVEHHKQLTGHLLHAIDGMKDSSQNLESTGQQLNLLSNNTRTASTELAGALSLLNTGLAKTNEENSQLAGILISQSQQLRSLQEGLFETATELKKTTEYANQGFNQMEEHQKSFLTGLAKEFGSTLEEFTDQVHGLEKTTQEWLQSYSDEVLKQTIERMQVWNTQTIIFAEEMKGAVSMISDLVDGIEQKVDSHA